MSEISNLVYEKLTNVFPHFTIVKEHYVQYERTRLYFDFFIKELGVFIEVQGQQHVKFNKFFHVTVENFIKQKNRDNMKIAYVQDNNMYLVRFYFDDKIDDSLILSRIEEVVCGGDSCFV